jgi:hypothetical protein
MSTLINIIDRYKTALKLFLSKFDQLKQEWNDPVRLGFEKNTVEALEQPQKLLLNELQNLDRVITRAREQVK